MGTKWMRWTKWTLGMVAALMLVAGAAAAVQFMWTDDKGGLNSTDREDKLPPQYRSILRYDVDHYTSPDGLGFEHDSDGNIRFFDHSSPAKKVTKRYPPANMDNSAPGSAVTPEQLAGIKQRYNTWGKEARPEMQDAKVTRVISPDTFEIAAGQKVAFVGIEFPEELKGETKISAEVMNYEKKLMQGKSVKLIYGPQRQDDKGRLLAYVFVGTDMFVNADLVMNGYARVKTVPPNTDYKSLFTRLEEFAQKSSLGIWDKGISSAATPAPAAAPTPATTPAPKTTP
jgi:micrococcal nuclease